MLDEDFARKVVRSLNEKRAVKPKDDKEFGKLYLENLTLKKKLRTLEKRFEEIDAEVEGYKGERDTALAEIKELRKLLPKSSNDDMNPAEVNAYLAKVHKNDYQPWQAAAEEEDLE